MSTHESTLGRARLSFAETSDLARFVETLGKFERGEIGPDEWRAFRLVNGTYGQRQEEYSMLRAKIPQGLLTAPQLEAVATVAERFARGFAHLTTRQNFQFHFMRLSEMEAAMTVLAEAGLTTREACGNAVRNVTASPSAGVLPDEAFDVTPYAEALTRYLLRHSLSSSLPRKFKIAFSGGGADHSFVAINDIGFTARAVNGKRCFRVAIAGGTATLATSARELFDALGAEEILAVAEAVLRVFHARGDRVHRHKNRMKFLVKQLGWETFRALVLEELERVRREGTPPLPFSGDPDDEGPPREGERAPAPSRAELAAIVGSDALRGPGIVPRFLPSFEGWARWRRTNVVLQRQAGFAFVTITTPLGDLSAGRLRGVARLALAFSDGTVRTTAAQNLVLRWVPEGALPQLFDGLAALGLASSDPDSLADVTSCPGAETCKLAVTQSRGVADLVSTHFATKRDLVDAFGPGSIRVSGCPNGCGLHHVAAIGLQGGMRKIDDRAVPQYFVYVGGDGAEGHFGRVVAKVPARRAPEALERLARFYVAERRQGETAAQFFRRAEVKRMRELTSDLEVFTLNDTKPEDFVDLGESEAFVPSATEGECAA